MRGCLPPFLVVAAILVIVVGGFVAGGATLHPPVELAGGDVVVTPLLGWVPADELSWRQEFTGVRLTNGSAQLDVLVAEAGDARALLEAYVDGPLQDRAITPVFSGRPTATALESGVAGLRLLYSAVDREDGYPVEGEITAVVGARATGAVLDGWGEEGSFAFARDEVVEIVDDTAIAR